MSRLCRETSKTQLLSFAMLLGLGLFLSVCGGGSGSSTPLPTTGPDAILNGATLSAATNHWVSTQCRSQVELNGDHTFFSIYVDKSGRMSSGSEKWSVGNDSNSVTVGPGDGGLGGFYWVSSLREISGSTSSKTFTADVSVETGSTNQTLGSCTFSLMQNGLG